MLRFLVGLLLIVQLAWAHDPGQTTLDGITQGNVPLGCGGPLELPPSNFSCACTAFGPRCSVINPFGSCIGEPVDLCGTFDLTGVTVTLPVITGNSQITGTLNVGGDTTITGSLIDIGAFRTATAGIGNIFLIAKAATHTQAQTLGNEEFRSETIGGGAVNPNFRIFHRSGTVTGAATLNIDLPLTTNSPTDPPCPSNNICMVEARVICHCTGGSSCTTQQGAGHITTWVVKNAAGTITQVGATASGNELTTVIDGSSLTSITASISTPNFRLAVVGIANFNHRCDATYFVSNVGA